MNTTALPEDLVRRARSADPEALSTIYERFAPGIYRYVYYRIGDAEVARDIQSDVFLRMLESIERYEDRGWSIGSWLYSIAHARTVDTMRRNKRRKQAPLSEWCAISEGPETKLTDRINEAALQEALSHLSEAQRQVILLRHSYGLSLEETANQLGRSIGAVKSLQHRAHERLARLIRTSLGEDDSSAG